MNYIGLDLGSGRCKAVLYDEDGVERAASSEPMPALAILQGLSGIVPDELWATVRRVIRALNPARFGEPVSIAVTSMAETGALLRSADAAPKTPFLPWYDRSAQRALSVLLKSRDPVDLFRATGLRASFKNPLTKLLWLREAGMSAGEDDVWLSVADYVVYRLTGVQVTDATLAQRTLAYHIEGEVWDSDWLSHLGFPTGLFPQVQPSGTAAGEVDSAACEDLLLPSGSLAAVAGHDHLCAAYGAMPEPHWVIDSMGTAEVLIGTMQRRKLNRDDAASGLAFGLYVVPGEMFWLGSIPASGGSVEWVRDTWFDAPPSYDSLSAWVAPDTMSPTTVMYFPYLSGSNMLADDAPAGALLNLRQCPSRLELVQAVFQGLAFEAEFIRRQAELLTGQTISGLLATGGGSKNSGWLQLKADVGDTAVRRFGTSEAAALGAAKLVARRLGSTSEPFTKVESQFASFDYLPDKSRHVQYTELMQREYLRLRAKLWPAPS